MGSDRHRYRSFLHLIINGDGYGDLATVEPNVVTVDELSTVTTLGSTVVANRASLVLKIEM